MLSYLIVLSANTTLWPESVHAGYRSSASKFGIEYNCAVTDQRDRYLDLAPIILCWGSTELGRPQADRMSRVSVYLFKEWRPR
jgi:hypothetical protein